MYMYMDVDVFIPTCTCRSWCDMASPLQYRNTALTLASGYGHVECVKVLLDRGAQANLQDKVSAVPDQTNVSSVLTCFLV